jgi:hypothetical protein
MDTGWVEFQGRGGRTFASKLILKPFEIIFTNRARIMRV